MNLFSKFSVFFKKRKQVLINESPLQFSKEAIQKINSHLEKRPAHAKSAFKVLIVYQKETILCQVGYDDFKLIQKTKFEYPIPLLISEQDELFLRGSFIDYHEEDDSFFYYPNVNLEVFRRKSNSIFVFSIDRYIISEDSPIQKYAIDKVNLTKSEPYFINQIFNSELVESLFLEKNIISIEKIKGVDEMLFEEKMSDIILTYFEKCGYSLYITNKSIGVKKFAT